MTKEKGHQKEIDRANEVMNSLSKESKITLSSEICSLLESTGIVSKEELVRWLLNEANRATITAGGIILLVELEKAGIITMTGKEVKAPSTKFPKSNYQTFGEKAVGLGFNPAKDPKVQQIKESYAKTIDYLENERRFIQAQECTNSKQSEGKKERLRQLSIAITEAQTSQMWAVKSLTWRD
jgi:hypothetical protein